MAYVKNTWATGDVIDAEKLNNMEDGIESAQNDPLVVEGTLGEDEQQKTTITLDKTAAELYDAAENGKKMKISAALGEDSSFTCVAGIDCYLFDMSGTVTYTFRFVNQDGAAYLASGLSDDDPVVLVEQ